MSKKFYWGNSSSSMQTEGAWNEGGKGPSVYDVRKASELASDWKVATDSYHRYQEDFDYMKELGMNMYRFQTAWSRVNPTGDGEWNEEGFAFYDKFIDDLIATGIEPMLCLYHFDMPLHLAEKYNGFLDRHVMEAFVEYGKKMVDRYKGKVKHWLTFNEQNLYHIPEIAFRVSGYLKGDKTVDELYQIQHNVMMAHAKIANYIHETTDCQISGMLAYSEVYPATCLPEDYFAASKHDEFINMALLECFTHGKYSEEVMKYVEDNNIDMGIKPGDLEELSRLYSDYLSFSYYRSTTIDSTKIPADAAPNYYIGYGQKDNPLIPTTEWNWQIDPLGFRSILVKMYRRFKLPIFPIENGIGVIEQWDGVNEIEDDYRIDYHRNHLKAMFDAQNIDGVEILGYLGWGLIDILSSQGDMRKRYGLVYVNRENHDLKDLKRVPKKSFHWFQKVTASDGKDL
jgi:Beta-glucosidase/6-phospho-beta-glucosidase/beta-galactosidase